jgi:hypothetical protein
MIESTSSPWRSYRERFEQNVHRPLPILDSRDGRAVDPERRTALAAILARFQLGEAGEGRVAKEIDGVRLAAVDDDYRRALKLVVREEGRHARILSALVDVLDGVLLKRKASDRLFTHARRLLGLRFKLIVVVVAEVVGDVVYGALAARLAPGAIRDALVEMADDESHHLPFHVAFLKASVPAWLTWPARIALNLVGFGANLVVFLENRHEFRVLGIDPRALAAETQRRLAEAGRAAFLPTAPVSAEACA